MHFHNSKSWLIHLLDLFKNPHMKFKWTTMNLNIQENFHYIWEIEKSYNRNWVILKIDALPVLSSPKRQSSSWKRVLPLSMMRIGSILCLVTKKMINNRDREREGRMKRKTKIQNIFSKLSKSLTSSKNI